MLQLRYVSLYMSELNLLERKKMTPSDWVDNDLDSDLFSLDVDQVIKAEYNSNLLKSNFESDPLFRLSPYSSRDACDIR